MSQSRPARRYPTSNRQSRKAVFTRDPGPRREFLHRIAPTSGPSRQPESKRNPSEPPERRPMARAVNQHATRVGDGLTHEKANGM